MDHRTFTEHHRKIVGRRAAVVPTLFVDWQLSDVVAPPRTVIDQQTCSEGEVDDGQIRLLCRIMLHVYAMCGVAFSGKSTLALRIAAELSICLISLDAINHKRGLRGGDGPSFITRTVGRRRCSDGAFVTHDPQKTRATYCTISSFVGQPHALSKCLGNRARHKSCPSRG